MSARPSTHPRSPAEGPALRNDEWDLILALAHGDPGAVAAVYTQHHAAVRSLARRLTADAGAAEDLVHDVFVALPAAAKRFRGQATLATFLCSIAVNHARRHVRSAIRRRAALDRLGRIAGTPPENPENQAARHELADALARALDRLPLDQRTAFVLCEVEGLSAAEAATIVAAPEATVRTRLFHARRRLRALLGGEAAR